MRIRFIIPGDINTPTGGYRYDRTIITAWEKRNHAVDLISLDGAFPLPDEDALKDALEQIARATPADIAVIDGLAGGGSPLLLETLSRQMPTVALIHHPLALENGLSEDEATLLKTAEKQGLDYVSAVVTTSAATRETIHSYFDFPLARIHAVLPGVERGTSIPFRTGEPLSILSVGSITHRKGHDVLIKALARLKHLSWTLTIVGPQHFDPALFQALEKLVQDNGLKSRIRFLDALNEAALNTCYENADIFALVSRYEGYGMAYAEALVRGIPVIGTTAGAIPDTVPQGCGLLVAPDDIAECTTALQSLITDENLRRRIHDTALLKEPDFPSWERSADQFLDHLRRLI